MEGKSGDAVEGARYPGCFSYDRLKALEKPREGPSGCFVPEATWKESGGPAPFFDAPLTITELLSCSAITELLSCSTPWNKKRTRKEEGWWAIPVCIEDKGGWHVTRRVNNGRGPCCP